MSEDTTTAPAITPRGIELGGSSPTDRADDLDRYWRDVRVHTLHDPVRWKAHWIGAWHLDGRIPPRHGAL